jgi:serine/threonine protein kinase
MPAVRASTRAETVPWRPDGERFGPYAVHEQLATGGLSRVCRATDTRRGREVALKRLHEAFEPEWGLVDAFLAEAKLANQLVHPHIARTLAYGKLDGTYFAANELVLGPTLEAIARQSRTAAGAIPVGVVVELLVQLCDALDYLHAATPRVVLCGLAAADAMVSNTGRVKLIDLGLAQTAARPTPRPGPANPRDDLYALGAIAHELLAGRRLRLPAQPPSRWAPGVPRELDELVLRALAPDPADRWTSAQAMGVALGDVANRLGGRLALSQRIREWLVWAFARPPRRDTTEVIELLEAIERGA